MRYRKNAVWTETKDEDMVDRNIGRGHWTQLKEEDMANTTNECTVSTGEGSRNDGQMYRKRDGGQ